MNKRKRYIVSYALLRTNGEIVRGETEIESGGLASAADSARRRIRRTWIENGSVDGVENLQKVVVYHAELAASEELF